METAYYFGSVTDLKKFTGFGGVIASRSCLFESLLMSSMTDESPPVLDESDLGISRRDIRYVVCMYVL